MKHLFSSTWAFFIASGLLFFVVIFLWYLIVQHNNGQFVYVLDDPYIHMSLAGNVALHGVWGVTPFEFTSASSSVLWTVILSVFFALFGVYELFPFFLNGVLSVGILFFLFRMFRGQYGFIALLCILLSFVFLTPFPALIFTGQEHLMHILFTLLFAYLSSKYLFKESSIPFYSLCFLAALLVSARYEGLFLVAIVCLLFLFRKRFVQGVVLGVFSILPISIFGIYSMFQGWYFVPNSVLLKGNVSKMVFDLLHADVGSMSFFSNLMSLFGYALYDQLIHTPHVLFLFIALLIVFIIRYHSHRFWESGQILIILFLVTTLIHMQFAKTGWFFRYEAYLVALGLFAVFLVSSEYMSFWFQKCRNFKKSALPCIGMIVLLSFPFVAFSERAIVSLIQIPKASGNIYEQQYQMGRFLKQFYEGETIVANDIGAITFLADIGLVDFGGLASMEVVQMKKRGEFHGAYLDEYLASKGVSIAIIYDHVFDSYGGIPAHWVKVGEWTIEDNVVCASSMVSFYAVKETAVEGLERNLQEFVLRDSSLRSE